VVNVRDMDHETDNVLARRMADLAISQATMAKLIGKSAAIVSQWVTGNKRISAESAYAIERATEGRITRMELRPDIFGPLQ